MPGDRELVQIVDLALAEAARKAGPWLACRRGCTACCMGPFAVNALDAERLRRGLAELDPERAAAVLQRAAAYIGRIERDYPGDTLARVLAEDEAAEDEPCPALDPDTGACDLYAARPLTCRAFGPPVRFDGQSLAVCELCFDGATPEQVAACEVTVDLQQLEQELLATVPPAADTLVAYALLARQD
jgi:Fe-S-cluster containining protein